MPWVSVRVRVKVRVTASYDEEYQEDNDFVERTFSVASDHSANL